MRAVILGIGNIILSDEAVGVRVIEALERDYALPEGVQAIDGGTSGMEMIEDLSDLDLLVVVDAVLAGKEPGDIVRIAGDEIPVFFRKKLSPHQIALPDVLASLEFLGAMPKEIVVIGIQPVTFELGMEMTPLIAAKVPDLVACVVAEFATHGCPLAPRVAAAA